MTEPESTPPNLGTSLDTIMLVSVVLVWAVLIAFGIGGYILDQSLRTMTDREARLERITTENRKILINAKQHLCQVYEQLVKEFGRNIEGFEAYCRKMEEWE